MQAWQSYNLCVGTEPARRNETKLVHVSIILGYPGGKLPRLVTCPKQTHVRQAGNTVQILCIGTDRSQQTVQTKIRLLLEKQSDQGLRCLPFHQHLLDA